MDISEFITLLEQQRKETDAIYHAAAVKCSLSDTAMWILYMLTESPEAYTQQDLCGLGFYAKQTVNTAIQTLLRRECVTLEPVPGTRNRKRVVLTETGRALAKITVDPLCQAELRAYGCLTEAERDAYLALTTRITTRLREEFETL